MADLSISARDEARTKADGKPLPPTDPSGSLSSDQLRRWGAWIVEQGDEIPDDLSTVDRCRLTLLVRSVLRERLLAVIARAIAHDLHRRQEDGRRAPND